MYFEVMESFDLYFMMYNGTTAALYFKMYSFGMMFIIWSL